MEIQHARIRSPLLDGFAYAVVIQRGRPAEPATEIPLRPDIVARQDMETAKTSQQYVLGRPSAYAAQFPKLRECPLVVFVGQTLDVNVASIDCTCESQ